MQFKDYYQILKVSRQASALEIKKAFRQLALQYHPDRNPEKVRESGEKFKEINEAYEILSDEQRRWHYDRLASLRLSGASFVVKRADCGKPGGCGRHQGGQCQRKWR